ncbi:MAG: VWA domain-containing protein [Gammaproteobacteria bacterium]|nr:VWA domain-containing protein [Gammaproteobacteria bacterium]
MRNIRTPSGMPNAFPQFTPKAQTIATSTVNVSTNEKIKKAGSNGVLIHVVLDESSSMSSVTQQTIDSFNSWLKEQQIGDGECLLTLSKFNGSQVKYIFENKDIKTVEPLTTSTYRPSGSTNLLDAIGDNITKANAVISSKKKAERPGVIVVILTDGEENCSNRFNKTAIKALVEKAEGKDWTFLFMGANIDAFHEGSAMGFGTNNTVQYNTSNMAGSMAALSSITTRTRTAYAKGFAGDALRASATYTQAERDQSL